MTAPTLSPAPAPWLDAKGAAAVLGVHPDDIYKLVADGTVPARRLGRRLRFVPAELDEVGRFDPASEPRPVRAPREEPLPQLGPQVAVAVPLPAEPEPKPRKAKRQSISAQLAALDPYAHLKQSA